MRDSFSHFHIAIIPTNTETPRTKIAITGKLKEMFRYFLNEPCK